MKDELENFLMLVGRRSSDLRVSRAMISRPKFQKAQALMAGSKSLWPGKGLSEAQKHRIAESQTCLLTSRLPEIRRQCKRFSSTVIVILLAEKSRNRAVLR